MGLESCCPPQDREAEVAQLTDSLEASVATATAAEAEGEALRARVVGLEAVAAQHTALVEVHRAVVERVEALEAAQHVSG